MHPMTAMVTPGKWPVASVIAAVVSCKSKSVRPHDGHETNSDVTYWAKFADDSLEKVVETSREMIAELFQ